MAIDFPVPVSVGEVFTDPTSGNQYVCTVIGPPAQWVGAGSNINLDNTYLKLDASNDPMTGDLDTLGLSTTGQVTGNETAITAGAGGWDLSSGNNWTLGAVVVPQPTNGVAGQSGTVTVTAAPTSWPAGGTLKYASGTAPAPTSFPAVIPFYVQSANSVLLGRPTEGIA